MTQPLDIGRSRSYVMPMSDENTELIRYMQACHARRNRLFAFAAVIVGLIWLMMFSFYFSSEPLILDQLFLGGTAALSVVVWSKHLIEWLGPPPNPDKPIFIAANTIDHDPAEPTPQNRKKDARYSTAFSLLVALLWIGYLRKPGIEWFDWAQVALGFATVSVLSGWAANNEV